MALLLWLAVPVILVIGLLWSVNRGNPGTFRTKDFRAENQMESRKDRGSALIQPAEDWGPRGHDGRRPGRASQATSAGSERPDRSGRSATAGDCSCPANCVR